MGEAPEALARLRQLAFGGMAAQVVSVATRLKLPDAFGDDERSAEEIAGEYSASPQAMNRLLRALAALEVLTEVVPGRYRLAPLGSLLRTDEPRSMHAFARMFTDPIMLRAWEQLDVAVRTGGTTFEDAFGTDFFGHLKSEPEMSALFNGAMSQATRATASVLPGAYDFGRFQTLVDVGGGDGTLLAAVLGEHPQLRGIVFDTEEGSAQAPKTLRAAGVADRCPVETGDFFAGVAPGGDLYLVKSILHDWDDERAASILRHCRTHLPEHGRLLIVEPVLAETVDKAPSPTIYLSDLNMLVNVGGLERTRADFEKLCALAGFTLTTVTALGTTGMSLLEATPA